MVTKVSKVSKLFKTEWEDTAKQMVFWPITSFPPSLSLFVPRTFTMFEIPLKMVNPSRVAQLFCVQNNAEFVNNIQ